MNDSKRFEELDRLSEERGVTTPIQRFREALTLLCAGHKPDLALCEQWFDKHNDAAHSELQDWASCHGGVDWAMGIGIIEAALTLAENPREGEGHL